jgi:hypothetical protein
LTVYAIVNGWAPRFVPGSAVLSLAEPGPPSTGGGSVLPGCNQPGHFLSSFRGFFAAILGTLAGLKSFTRRFCHHPGCATFVIIQDARHLAAQTGLTADFYPNNPTIDNSIYR